MLYTASRKIFLSLVLIVLSFFIVQRFLVSINFFATIGSLLVYPALVVQSYVVQPIKARIGKRATIKELHKQITQLKSDKQQLLSDTIQLHSTLYHLEQNQAMIDFYDSYCTQDAHLCQILLKNIDDSSHYYLVQGGSRAGITTDMVAVYKNCLVGRVAQVYPYYSKVVLITDSDCKVGCYCNGTKATGIHEGLQRTDLTSLKFVSHLERLRKGDLLISSGEGLLFPQGFGLGHIADFEGDGLYYNVLIEPLIDVRELSYCYVMHKE